MFEKEAEEWVENNLHSTEEDYIKAYKDGAEFGYNKANEWHYVKDEEVGCVETDFNTFKSKAKEIIKDLLGSENTSCEEEMFFGIRQKAEQFLKDNA